MEPLANRAAPYVSGLLGRPRKDNHVRAQHAAAGSSTGGGTPINTMDQRLRVFVSSTMSELADDRQAARTAITRLHLTPVMFEVGARSHPAGEVYRAYLRQSDVFVGIYGRSYGWVAPAETVSGLEDEYLLSGDRPKLIYVKTGGEREPRLQGLLDRIQADDRVAYKHFTNADDLVELLADDLAVLLTERFTPVGTAAGLLPGSLPAPPTPIIGREQRRPAPGSCRTPGNAGRTGRHRQDPARLGGRPRDARGHPC
jgi:hypothetical protein